jgi:hypothetical protein
MKNKENITIHKQHACHHNNKALPHITYINNKQDQVSEARIVAASQQAKAPQHPQYTEQAITKTTTNCTNSEELGSSLLS